MIDDDTNAWGMLQQGNFYVNAEMIMSDEGFIFGLRIDDTKSLETTIDLHRQQVATSTDNHRHLYLPYINYIRIMPDEVTCIQRCMVKL